MFRVHHRRVDRGGRIRNRAIDRPIVVRILCCVARTAVDRYVRVGSPRVRARINVGVHRMRIRAAVERTCIDPAGVRCGPIACVGRGGVHPRLT
jgi:hypothetical protein